MSQKKDDSQGRHPAWLQATVNTLDQKIVAVNYGLYFLAFGGLAYAMRRVRPFKKFVRPKDIPYHFFEKRLKLTGKVIGLDFGQKPLLLVDHKPLLFGRFRQPGPGLPVSLESIEISGNGVSWLQSLVVGKNVSLMLLEPHAQFIACIVNQEGKPKSDVASLLVNVGFAKVGPPNPNLAQSKQYKVYYSNLQKCQRQAQWNGHGIWMNVEYNFLSRAFTYMLAHINSKLIPMVWRSLNKLGKSKHVLSPSQSTLPK